MRPRSRVVAAPSSTVRGLRRRARSRRSRRSPRPPTGRTRARTTSRCCRSSCRGYEVSPVRLRPCARRSACALCLRFVACHPTARGSTKLQPEERVIAKTGGRSRVPYLVDGPRTGVELLQAPGDPRLPRRSLHAPLFAARTAGCTLRTRASLGPMRHLRRVARGARSLRARVSASGRGTDRGGRDVRPLQPPMKERGGDVELPDRLRPSASTRSFMARRRARGRAIRASDSAPACSRASSSGAPPAPPTLATRHRGGGLAMRRRPPCSDPRCAPPPPRPTPRRAPT